MMHGASGPTWLKIGCCLRQWWSRDICREVIAHAEYCRITSRSFGGIPAGLVSRYYYSYEQKGCTRTRGLVIIGTAHP